MILKYKKELKVLVVKGCEHVENGIIRRDDLMQTDFIPLNFNGSYKNYVLRDGHEAWDTKQHEAEQNIVNQWLVELGYNPSGFRIDYEKQEIISKDNPHWFPDQHKATGAVEKDREVESI
jgi:hypothetical protein